MRVYAMPREDGKCTSSRIYDICCIIDEQKSYFLYNFLLMYIAPRAYFDWFCAC